MSNTETYTPSAAYGARDANPIERTSAAEALQLQQLALNTKILQFTNPWMNNRPDLQYELAAAGIPPDELATQSAALYGMQSMDALNQSLRGLSPVAQRAVYGKLTETQQRALDTLGYATPQTQTSSGAWGDIGSGIARGMGALGEVGGPVLGGALDVLTFVGDQPAHLYRTIRQMDDWTQVAALVGAGVALALAPVTFGGSLAAAGTLTSLGILGGSALAGATIAAAVTNPADWWDALNSTWDGEKVFTRGAQRRARDLLGGDQYTMLAKELALELDPYELATEIAGERGAGSDQQILNAIEKVAQGLVDPGSAEYEKLFVGLVNLVSQEPFRQAIDVLQQGKISFGRDVARTVGMSPNSAMYGLTSGMIDGLWAVTMDPTMALGAVNRWNKVRRFGLGEAGGEAFLQRLTHLSNTDRLTRANHEQMARAITTGDFTLMPKAARGLWSPMQEFKRRALIDGDFGREHVLEFFHTANGMQQLLSGKATIRGYEQLILHRGSESAAWGRFVRELRGFRDGLDDATLEKAARGVAKKHGVELQLEDAFPSRVFDKPIHSNLVEAPGVDERFAGQIGYQAGKMFSYVPGGRTMGSLLASITSMTPPNKAIRLVGEGMEDDVPRLIETLGRALNMPSRMRDEWLNAVMVQGSVSQRRIVMESFLDTGLTLGGMRSNPELSRLADSMLHFYGKAYALGGLDRATIAGVSKNIGVLPEAHQAVLMVMPDLAAMTRIIRRGHFLKHVARVTDHNLVETSMSRFWKPAVLMRIGFIPRAAGEEALAFLARMSEFSLGQEFGARSLAQGVLYQEARAAQRAGDVLDQAQELALKWEVPTHVRPLWRMASRWGWSDPVEQALETYGTALRGFLDDGIGLQIGEPAWYHGLLFGKAGSWRRAVANGIDPEIREAVELYTRDHADAMMRAVSSLNASQFEHSIVNPDVEYYLVEDPKNPGKFLEEPMVTMRGERIRTGQSDPRFPAAIHHRAAESFDDEIVGPAIADGFTHFWPGFTDIQPQNVVNIIETSRALQGWTSRKLFLEAIQGRPDNWRAAATMLERDSPELASIVKGALLKGDVEWADITNGIARQIASMDPRVDQAAIERLEFLQQELSDVAVIVDGMKGLSIESQSWLAAALSADVASKGTYYDSNTMRKWAAGGVEMTRRPERVLYRGVKDASTLEVRPNGDLVLRPQYNGDWDGDVISMTKLPDQALGYAVSMGPYNSGSRIGAGAVVEVDADFALSQYNKTLDDLNANPTGYNGITDDMPAGAYLIGNPPGQFDKALNRDLTFEDAGEVAFVMRRNALATTDEWDAASANYDRVEGLLRQVRHGQLTDEQLVKSLDTGEFKWMDRFGDRVDADFDVRMGTFGPEDMPVDVVAVKAEVIRETLDEYRQLYDSKMAGILEDPAYVPGGRTRPETSIGDEIVIPAGRWAIQSQGDMAATSAALRAGQESRWPWLSDVAYETPSGRPAQALIGELQAKSLTIRQRSGGDAFLDLDSSEELAAIDEITGWVDALDPADRAWLGQTLGFRLEGEGGQLDQWILSPARRSFARAVIYDDLGLDKFVEASQLRGQGGFEIEIPAWHPFHTDRDAFIRSLEDSVAARLARPEFAEHVRKSEFALQTADGRPVAQPMQEGLQRVYPPMVGDGARIEQVVVETMTHGDPDVEFIAGVVDKLLNTGTPYRVHTQFIRQLPLEVREQALADAVEAYMIGRKPGQVWSVPLGHVAYDDPRVAQWVGDVLTGSVAGAPTSTAYVDIPRGNPSGMGVEWGNELDKAGRSWKLDDSRAGTVAMIDSDKVVTLADGSQAPGVAFTEALQDYARTIVRKTTTEHSTRTRETYTARANDAGEASVFRMTGTRMEPVAPGERLGMREDLYDAEGRPVNWADENFFDLDVTTGNDFMWPLIGPMIRDHFERQAGFMSEVPKQLRESVRRGNVGDEVLPDGRVSMPRSRIDDVHKVQGELSLPNVALTEVRTARNDQVWDRVVRFGFDKVIGPSIDAIVRKPMAVHYFVAAHRENKRFMTWMLDSNLIERRIPDVFGDELTALTANAELAPEVLMDARRVAADVFGVDLHGRSDQEVGRWLISIADTQDRYRLTLTEAATEALRQKNRVAQEAAKRLMSADITAARLMDVGGGLESPGQRLVKAYHDTVPAEIWAKGRPAVNEYMMRNEISLPLLTDGHTWETALAARNNYAHVQHVIGETAKLRAIENIIPFLDSHEQRSQFATIGRNLFPFWYAEENFLKRWGRVMANDGTLGLATVRKAQLGYMGIRSAGIVRTDSNGKDWFVYPGSGLLAEAVAKIPFIGDNLPVGVLMQASTDSMLPGVNERVGTPSPSPFVAVGMDAVTTAFPDAVPLKRAVLGDLGSSKAAITQFVPSTIQRVWEAAFGDEDSSRRYAAAMMAAAAMMEAEGNGLPDNAAPEQVDLYLDRLRNHARVIMWTQVITGFLSPGAPVAVTTGEDAGSFAWLTGLGVESPDDVLSAKYRTYIQNMGIDEGTSRFLADFPDADLEDIVNPLAFTVSTSSSRSGAPLPATRTGLAWYEQNADWINAMPEAGAWFLPADQQDETFDFYSYNQQLVSGLRKQRTPEEFVRSLKYRQGASSYFDTRDQYERAAETLGNDMERKRMLDDLWESWRNNWMNAHPIFAEELVSGEARQRRQRTIEQLRYAVDDPQAPASPHLAAIREMSKTYDTYRVALMQLNESRGAEAQDRARKLKALFEDWAAEWTLRNPDLEQMWSAVFRPEASL